MEFLEKDITAYIEQHTESEPALLQQLNRHTHLHVLKPRMLSGHFQGRVLSLLSHMIRPASILEIGTYTGYSALCLAEGLQPGGRLVTIDINSELEAVVRKFLQQSPLAGQIEYVIGNALYEVPKINTSFDLVFIDADKINYSRYFDLVIDKVPAGGYIIADNVLWSGKVLPKNRKKDDEDTLAVLSFNKKVADDGRVQNVLLPIRDGLMVLRKLPGL